MNMKTFAGAALLLALSVPVLAAPPGPMMGQGPGEGRMGMMQGMCPMGMGQRTEGALAFLKTELKIASSQTSAWEAFATAYRDAKAHRGPMPMMRDGMMMGPGAGPAKPLPERMAQHLAMMEGHLAQMKKLQPAVAQLYAALTADQRKTADEVVPMFLMCRMM
jgi:hypothetical protein